MEIGNIYELLGTTGSLIMCASSIPQIIKTYRTKSADSLSGSYLAILIMGMLLILSYALYRKDIVFIFGNVLSLLLTGILGGLWYRYRFRISVPERIK
jgi:MtN3 and saliva related transmembrane protein